MSVLAVPRSMARSLEKYPLNDSNMRSFSTACARNRVSAGAAAGQSKYDNLICFTSAPLSLEKRRKASKSGTLPQCSRMALSIQDIQRIAHLARIEITSAEAQDVQRKLDGIFDLINEMRAVDTTGIVPMSHAQEVTAPLREDHVSEPD